MRKGNDSTGAVRSLRFDVASDPAMISYDFS